MHGVDSRGPADYVDAFDTPTLVEVWRTAPYLHDGRYATIQELLVDGQHGRGEAGAAALSHQDLADLIAFVLSL